MSGKVSYRIQRAKTGVWEGAWEVPNLRTNAGINQQALMMGSGYDGSASGTIFKQIAITQDTTTPASTMTNLEGEIAADGLSRKTATYSHTANASSYTQTASWQNTGSTYTIAEAALCTHLTDADASADTHFAVTALSPVAVLDSNDTLEIAWGIFF